LFSLRSRLSNPEGGKGKDDRNQGRKEEQRVCHSFHKSDLRGKHRGGGARHGGQWGEGRQNSIKKKEKGNWPEERRKEKRVLSLHRTIRTDYKRGGERKKREGSLEKDQGGKRQPKCEYQRGRKKEGV